MAEKHVDAPDRTGTMGIDDLTPTTKDNAGPVDLGGKNCWSTTYRQAKEAPL